MTTPAEFLFQPALYWPPEYQVFAVLFDMKHHISAFKNEDQTPTYRRNKQTQASDFLMVTSRELLSEPSGTDWWAESRFTPTFIKNALIRRIFTLSDKEVLSKMTEQIIPTAEFNRQSSMVKNSLLGQDNTFAMEMEMLPEWKMNENTKELRKLLLQTYVSRQTLFEFILMVIEAFLAYRKQELQVRNKQVCGNNKMITFEIQSNNPSLYLKSGNKFSQAFSTFRKKNISQLNAYKTINVQSRMSQSTSGIITSFRGEVEIENFNSEFGNALNASVEKTATNFVTTDDGTNWYFTSGRVDPSTFANRLGNSFDFFIVRYLGVETPMILNDRDKIIKQHCEEQQILPNLTNPPDEIQTAIDALQEEQKEQISDFKTRLQVAERKSAIPETRAAGQAESNQIQNEFNIYQENFTTRLNDLLARQRDNPISISNHLVRVQLDSPNDTLATSSTTSINDNNTSNTNPAITTKGKRYEIYSQLAKQQGR